MDTDTAKSKARVKEKKRPNNTAGEDMEIKQFNLRDTAYILGLVRAAARQHRVTATTYVREVIRQALEADGLLMEESAE